MFTKLWTVKLSDWQRGLIVAILTTPFTIIYDSVSAGSLTFDWRKIVAAALAGGVGYILKNLLTGEQGRLLTNKSSEASSPAPPSTPSSGRCSLKLIFLMAIVALLCLTLGCATVQTMFGKETPEKTALRFTQTWSSEYDRTIRLVTSHLSISQQDLILAQLKDPAITDKAKADLLVANTNPNLTSKEKEMVNLRKKILVESKPLISAFNDIVIAGKSPSSSDQARIETILNDLATKYLIK